MFLRGTTQLLPYGEGKGAGLKFLMWAVEAGDLNLNFLSPIELVLLVVGGVFS